MGLSDLTKQKVKGIIKQYAVKIFKTYILKIVIVAVLIIVLLASAWYIIGKQTVSKVSNVVREDGINKNVTIDSNRTYKIDEDIIKRANEALKKAYINPNNAGLTDELLIKFYEAEVVTSFPDLRTRDKIGTSVPEGELQGCIQFKRRYSDGNEELLEYMDFNEFRREIAKFGYDLQDSQGNSISVSEEEKYSGKEQVESKFDVLKKYFTLDEENNVIIPTINTTNIITKYSDYAQKEPEEVVNEEDDEEDDEQEELEKQKDSKEYSYYVSVEKVNYQMHLEKYSMPIEFLISMLVVSQNNGFCEEIVNLVEKSKIIIEIHDNLTTITTTEDYDYVSDFNFSKHITYEVEVPVENPSQGGNNTQAGPAVPETETETEDITLAGTYTKNKDFDNPYKKITTINKINEVELTVTEANIWIAEYMATYNSVSENTTTEEFFPIDDERVYYNRGEEEDYHNLLDTLKGNIPSDASNIEEKCTLVEQQTKMETRVTTSTVSSKYTKNSTQVLEKEEKFLSLLKVDPNTNVFDKNDKSKNTKLLKYEDIYKRKTSPEGNILSAEQILFDYLSAHEKTQAFEETMRYLLYIYTGKSYGVTSLDFSIYEPSSFILINGGISGISGIQGKIYDFLLSKGMSGIGAAAILGNIERESSFNVSAINKSNPHYGLCQWGGGRYEKLKQEAKKVENTWEDLDVQLEFLWLELNTSYISTKEELINATDLYSAVEYFTINYEACGNYSLEVDIRYKYAEKWYELASRNNHSGVNDIQRYNLNLHEGFIEYKQLDYTTIPPAYQATSSPAGTIKDKGCMPTSISIILSGMGVKDAFGNAYTPETLISTGTMAHINGGSSTSANARNTFIKCGLTASEQKRTNTVQARNDILANLNAGNAILIHASKGYYTGEGHLMTLIDVDGNQVYLSNPGSRSKTGWVPLATLISRNVDWYMVVSR